MQTVLAVLTAVGLAAGPRAAARDEADDRPTVEVRVRAINDLLDKFEYVGALVGQEEAAKQGAAVVRAFAGKKGLEGVDVKRPIGLYAKLTPAMIDSPIVLLVPIADEEAFLNLLRTRLNLDPKKGDDGVYSLKVPNFNPTIYFRYHKGYACAAVHNRNSLDDANLIDPKAFFAEPDEAVASVLLRLDRVPAEVRKSVLGQAELQMHDARKRYEGDATARAGYELGSEGFFRALRTTLEEGGTTALRLLIDPKADELTLDLSLAPRDGTGLKAALAAAGGRKSAGAAAAAVGENPVASFAAAFALPEWAKMKLDAAIDAAVTDALDRAKGDEREAARKAFDAILPTAKAGEYDLGFALTGKPGALRLAAALMVKKGDGIEQTAKEFVPFLPADKLAVKTDVAKASGANVHELILADPEAKQAFGTDRMWLATSAERLVLTAEPEGATVRKLAAAAPAAGPIIAAEVSVARLLQLAEKGLPADELKGAADDVFEKSPPAGRDTARLTVTGGEKLTITAVVKGKAVRYAVLVDQKKKAK